MPFALVFIGLIMVVSGARDTYAQLGKELIEDFTGPGNFFNWFAAIAALGALGSIPQFKAFSRVFMALVIITMIIRNGGFFDKLNEALTGGKVVTPEKSNNNYVVGNTQATKNTLGANDSNGISILESIGTPKSRKNAQAVWDVAKWFI